MPLNRRIPKLKGFSTRPAVHAEIGFLLASFPPRFSSASPEPSLDSIVSAPSRARSLNLTSYANCLLIARIANYETRHIKDAGC